MTNAASTARVSSEALSWPSRRTYKADARSRVWLVGHDSAAFVIKRFEFARARQLTLLAIGCHPGQRERRVNRRLLERGVAVIPLAGGGLERGKLWLATPVAGESLQVMIQRNQPASRSKRNALIVEVIGLWAQLYRGGWFFRDFQVANIVIDEHGQARLIDVGSTRRSRDPRHARRMLRQLLHTARDEGLSWTDAWRATQVVCERCPELGPPRTLFAQ